MRSLLFVALLVATGCGSEIGDSCIISSDCDPNGQRYCDVSSKEGYCTIQGCGFDTCPDEAACIRFFTGNFSNLPCMSQDECTLDELCSLEGHCVPRSSEVRYCMKTCGGDGDCRDGYECRDLDKMIEHGGEPVLAPGVQIELERPEVLRACAELIRSSVIRLAHLVLRWLRGLRTSRHVARESLSGFLLRRLGSGLITILGVSVLVFAFLHIVPGDPVDHLAGDGATPGQREQLEKCLGLDQSVPMQFVSFLGHIVDGSLGKQCSGGGGDKRTVASRIFEVMPYTMALALAGMLVAILLALPLGVLAAVKRGTWIDTLATTTSLSAVAMPQMMFAPLLLVWFFLDLAWLPGPGETGLVALILPAFAVGTHLMAMLARMTRSSMVEVLGEDYVRTARAKGLPEGRVLFVHALRNALLPVITIVGLQFGSMLSGAIVIENVFSRPGLGTTLLQGIQERNYPVVQGCVLVIAVIYVLVNILVDLAYGLADPRIRRA